MKKITKISAQKTQGRYNLYLDDEFFCGVSEETLIELGLKKGMLIDEEAEILLEKKENKNKCFNACLALLGKQNYFEKNLILKLRSKGYSEEDILIAIDKIKDYGYINDEKLAVSFVKDKKRFSKKGSHYMVQALREKGVDPEIIKEVVSDNYSLEEELENCRAVAYKKFESYKKREENSYMLKGKLYTFLAQKGFTSEVIRIVIEEIFSIEDSF